MTDNFSLLPFPFWLSVAAWFIFCIRAWFLRDSSEGLPMLAVLGTVGVWYIGDALYNDYVEYYVELGPDALNAAWWEVLLFLVTFGTLTPFIHRYFNRSYLRRKSNLLQLVRHGVVNAKQFQGQVDVICRVLAVVWVLIMFVALIRTDYDFQGLFMPYLGEKATPWARGRVGGGFDFLIALVGYVLIGLAAGFGVVAAVASRMSTRFIAMLICFLALPTYVFDRTRSVMLATLLPGFLAWVFLRLRGHIVIKVGVLVVGFLVLESWLKFVIENRSEHGIASAFAQEMTTTANDPTNPDAPSANANGKKATTKHLGLNMLEELGFINLYIADGSYKPNWGERYLAELVNPIPRVLWPGKPLIGIDYAIARGMAYGDASISQGGVQASVSTGMIGQGVVNFSVFLGPIFAALLMAGWVTILARQDLLANEAGRLFIYSIGLLLTFNMGRDITLLVIYPFCFGYILVLVAKYRNFTKNQGIKKGAPAPAANPLSRTDHAAASRPFPVQRQIAPRYPRQ